MSFQNANSLSPVVQIDHRWMKSWCDGTPVRFSLEFLRIASEHSQGTAMMHHDTSIMIRDVKLCQAHMTHVCTLPFWHESCGGES